MKYLIPKSGKRASHIWVDTDTLCRMYSTGGLRRIDKYTLMDNAEDHPNHRRLCAMCTNVSQR